MERLRRTVAEMPENSPCCCGIPLKSGAKLLAILFFVSIILNFRREVFNSKMQFPILICVKIKNLVELGLYTYIFIGELDEAMDDTSSDSGEHANFCKP